MEDNYKAQFREPKGIIIDILQAVVIALAISIFIYIFIATPNQIEGNSMAPNFENGELVLTNKLVQLLANTAIGDIFNYEYTRGDVIVFQGKDGNDYIKRIIATPGDSIMIENDKVFINNKLVDERYLEPGIRTKGGTFLQEGDSKVVGENAYFVMGDNRADSSDSRYEDIQFVSEESIMGKVVFRYWPLNKISIISTGEIAFKN